MDIIAERKKWFMNKVDYSKLLDSYECSSFSEFTVNRWGDVVVYRVYGNSINNFSLCCR